MTFFEIGILSFVGFLIALLLLPKLVDMVADLRTGDGGHARRRYQFMLDRTRQGASPREAEDELIIRESFARLRRLASNRYAVAGSDECAVSIIDRTAAEIAERLARRRPDLVETFARMHAAALRSDILYPRELAKFNAAIAAEIKEDDKRRRRIGSDEYASLRIV